jgi:hypothetical protein
MGWDGLEEAFSVRFGRPPHSHSAPEGHTLNLPIHLLAPEHILFHFCNLFPVF